MGAKPAADGSGLGARAWGWGRGEKGMVEVRQDSRQPLRTSAPHSYVLKVVGGGPTLDTIKEYSEEEIYRFNSPLDK